LAGFPTSRWNVSNGSTGVASSTVKQVYADQLKVTDQSYTGKLWCIRVKSGAFFTKSRGKIYVTGNSVDSSSWVQIAVHGNILLPEFGSIAISADSPKTKEQNAHYDNLSDIHREAIRSLVEYWGFDIDRLRSSAYSRWCFNFWAFNQINERTNRANKTFKPEQNILFY
jgi:hypothetical protein